MRISRIGVGVLSAGLIGAGALIVGVPPVASLVREASAAGGRYTVQDAWPGVTFATPVAVAAPTFYVEARLAAGARLELDDAYAERAVNNKRHRDECHVGRPDQRGRNPKAREKDQAEEHTQPLLEPVENRLPHPV